ncbi:MAG: sulfur carrier protein ThiS [Gammaproteobacteria bacterium]
MQSTPTQAMKITLNGETREFPDAITAQRLLEELDLGDKRVAVEVNREIVPRSSYAQCVLRDGDRVEIVRAIGGG